MLNVLYLLNHAGKAGTERYVESLAAGLGGKSINVFFAYNEGGLLVEKSESMGIKTFRLHMGSRFDLKAAWRLSRLCRELSIDLIHTHYLRENYISLFSKIFNPKVKVIYTNHFILENDGFTRITNRILSALESKIIAVCNKGRDMLIKNGFSPKKIEVLFNAVDPVYWQEPLESSIKEEYNIGKDEFVLLCASRFASDKGHAFLVQGLYELKKLNPAPFKCILAGDGPLLAKIKEKAESLGLGNEVIFTGFRSDIKNLFYSANVYINSSEHEALSFLILEALASGLPLIATDMGGNGDIVNEETNCGILTKYNDPEGLAQAIKKLMDDPGLCARLRENALQAVQDRFNLDKMIEKTYNLYVQAIGIFSK